MNIINTLINGAFKFKEDHPFISAYVTGLVISMVIWGVYLEVNPQIGGVFIRPTPKGTRKFSLKGVWPMITYPFQAHHFWLPKNWDLNWIIFTQIGAGIWLILQNIDLIRSWIFKIEI